jgi:cysteine desulfuration protein SufE
MIGTTATGTSSSSAACSIQCRRPSIRWPTRCRVSQVWLSKHIDRSEADKPKLKYLGDSDAHIVRGLIAILLTLYSDCTPQQILAADATKVFEEFGFREHLTPQRSNGLRAMVERIRSDARGMLAAAS